MKQVEILAYRESHGGEVRLPAWRRQFVGKTAASPLRVGDDIANISGATLSCTHVTDGVRRIVAIVELAKNDGSSADERASSPQSQRRQRGASCAAPGRCSARWSTSASADADAGARPRRDRAAFDAHRRDRSRACRASTPRARSAASTRTCRCVHRRRHRAPRACSPPRARLCDASDGLFDVSLGTGASAWRCDDRRPAQALAPACASISAASPRAIAVDAAVATLAAHGVASGWVNAGGDLRVFGALTLPIDLRDETHGGVRRFATLGDGAFATSRLAFGRGSDAAATGHASVAAPECLWADALTKIVIASGDADHPLLARFGARAWLH